MKSVKKLLEENHIKPDLKHDQFFLTDAKVARKMVKAAGITKQDRVLEVGPGSGVLTRQLADQAKEVVAIEIDRRFTPFLKDLPDNVEIIYGDAYQLLNDKNFRARVKPPTKSVSNIPYSQAQNMLHNYTNYDWYQGDLVWLAPVSLVKRVNKEPILGAYFSAEVIDTIPSSCFYPEPKTTSAIIYFARITDPRGTGDLEVYFRRWLYNHEDWKVKNALREGIIAAGRELKGVKVTKNEARDFIENLGISKKELNKRTNNIRPEYYFSIPRQLQGWYKA